MKRIRTSRARLTRDQSGVVLIEFALLMPLLFLVLFGVLEFGRILNYWIDETHLANEAARWAAVDRNPGTANPVNGTTCQPQAGAATDLQTFIRCEATTEELRGGTAGDQGSDPLKVYICFPNGTSNVGDPVRVIVRTTYNYLPIVGDFLSGAFGDGAVDTTVGIAGSATMRLEAIPTNYTANPPPDGC
jgi:Flp pilus assembly protein TadG